MQELRKLVEHCWSPQPEDRPSFEDIVDRLEEVVKSLPRHAKGDGAGGTSGGCCTVA